MEFRLVFRAVRVPFAVVLCVAGILAARIGQAQSENVIVQKNVAVQMRDGVVLRADVLLPAAAGKFPVLVYRTPYGKDRAYSEWTTFAKAAARGYAVVVQDVRGRYESEGEFTPYQNEGRDGYDTIEWAAAQAFVAGLDLVQYRAGFAQTEEFAGAADARGGCGCLEADT